MGPARRAVGHRQVLFWGVLLCVCARVCLQCVCAVCVALRFGVPTPARPPEVLHALRAAPCLRASSLPCYPSSSSGPTLLPWRACVVLLVRRLLFFRVTGRSARARVDGWFCLEGGCNVLRAVWMVLEAACVWSWFPLVFWAWLVCCAVPACAPPPLCSPLFPSPRSCEPKKKKEKKKKREKQETQRGQEGRRAEGEGERARARGREGKEGERVGPQ